MPTRRLIKHKLTAQRDKNTQMRCPIRDVAISNKCKEAIFSFTGEDEVECIKGVEVFKYLGRPQARSDEDWLAVLRNTRKAQHVWGCIGKFL